MTRLEEIQARALPLPENARMDAYYYGFDRTGVGSVDAILSAVAIAGKGSHHTESWCDESDYGYYENRPGLPDATSAVDLIQKAAAVAAEDMTDLLGRLAVAETKLAAVEAVLPAIVAREEEARQAYIKGDYTHDEASQLALELRWAYRQIADALAIAALSGVGK